MSPENNYFFIRDHRVRKFASHLIHKSYSLFNGCGMHLAMVIKAFKLSFLSLEYLPAMAKEPGLPC